MWQVKRVLRKYAIRSGLLTGTTILLATMAIVPSVNAQVVIGINPPVCAYGYYDYSPYGCAPMGFYGPGYFYNGVFLGVGPWASWGYGHGWGDHRFSGGGGGSYVARGRNGGDFHAENHGSKPSAGRASHSSRASSTRSQAAAGHSQSHGATHATASRGASPHGSSHTVAARGASSHSSGSHGGHAHGGGEPQ
jgi:hypothetical protein